MTVKLVYLLFLIFAAFHTEKNSNEDTLVLSLAVLSSEEDSDENVPTKLNMFPNDSSVQIFRDMETNEISWEDPNQLIEIERKEKIESSLLLEGEEMANHLFDCFSNWFPPTEIHPFLKELIFTMSKSVDVDRRENKHNRTPLMLAVQYDIDAVLNLIKRGSEIGSIDKYGWTALHYAASNCCYRNGDVLSCIMCKLLLQSGANVDARTENCSTALMFAAVLNYVEVVKILLQHGADKKIRKKWNRQTALDYAKPNCANIIKAHETTIESNCCIIL